ncbi:hypothetical protein JHK87_054366 [Glycine soja]|nr:hypothetical protein JHK87_054366 [Glycine soja]
MESKRQSQQEGDERGVQILVHGSKRRREDSQQSDTFRTINNQIGISGTKPYHLVFKNELPATIYTNSKIQAKGNTPLEVALVDIESQSTVTEGSLSSIKIEICVLNGEFGSNGLEDWSSDQFNSKILPPRDNKGQLLKGDTIITLENGVGYITNPEITDNSSWIRTRRFRLGAKVAQSNLKDAINIREGISKPFIVKDARGEKKHDTPSLNDETWRLKHISKSGEVCQRLSKHGINTVEDLLKEHETNPSSLPEKFGKISKKKLEQIIKHAQKAKHDKTCVAEATFEGQNYHSGKNILISDEREHYKNLKDPVPIETVTHELVKALTPVTAQYSAPYQDVQQLDFPIEEISRLMDSLNWSVEGQFVDGNIWPVAIDDQNLSCSMIPPEAECSNRSSFPNSAMYKSDKGKSKMTDTKRKKTNAVVVGNLPTAFDRNTSILNVDPAKDTPNADPFLMPEPDSQLVRDNNFHQLELPGTFPGQPIQSLRDLVRPHHRSCALIIHCKKLNFKVYLVKKENDQVPERGRKENKSKQGLSWKPYRNKAMEWWKGRGGEGQRQRQHTTQWKKRRSSPFNIQILEEEEP